MYHYYFAIASENFFLDQEPIEEILRERIQYYVNNNREIDFWFVLNSTSINIIQNDNSYFDMSDSLAAIVSLDKQFIQWLKLRVSFVQIGSFKSESIFVPK
uniref:Ycf54 n=1 Tax=Ophidocladus simpliciusculus TaxID=1261574 RepID=A0A1Z1MJ90_9FLOR|nr:hypothetical protein [Ophidocladus simpliciusculus]ARW65912.1 hypothetical protein [Ophidocladus simpliciusculus]